MKRILATIFTVFWLYAPLVRAVEAPPSHEQPLDLLDDETKTESDSAEPNIPDPLEPMNRIFFVINDKLYFWVLKPVEAGYAAVVSPDIRKCIANFFENLASSISLVNNLLQGRLHDAGIVAERFLVNTTIGILGFADVASELDLSPKPADFGETLGSFGLGDGIYVFWPLIGPSNFRDTVGVAGDMVVHPTAFLNWNTPGRAGYFMGEKTNALSIAPETYEDLKKYTIDPYAAVRQGYIEYRHSRIERRKNYVKEAANPPDVLVSIHNEKNL